MMSDGEIRFIEDSADGASAFLRLWTMKEAWLKSVEFRSIFDAASLDFVKNGKIIGQMDGKTCLTVDNGEYVMSLWT